MADMIDPRVKYVARRLMGNNFGYLTDLVGGTVTDISGWEAGSDKMTMTIEDKWVVHFYHSQDCCECVCINDVIGDPQDLVGHELTMCEEVSSTGHAHPTECQDDSSTWTFYKFATIKGYVTVRWLGTSNGYYSESVDVAMSLASTSLAPEHSYGTTDTWRLKTQ